MNISSFDPSGGGTAHAWTVTFMSISGDVAELEVVDDPTTAITTGSVVVTERLKVSRRQGAVQYRNHSGREACS